MAMALALQIPELLVLVVVDTVEQMRVELELLDKVIMVVLAGEVEQVVLAVAARLAQVQILPLPLIRAVLVVKEHQILLADQPQPTLLAVAVLTRPRKLTVLRIT